jgi:cell division protein FtsL
MIWRLLHIVVLVALVLAAADVYKIKYESTLQAERVGKLRAEIRREQDQIATLRAEWSKLDRPDRIQMLAQRHLKLQPIDPRQFDPLDRLPERPVELVPPGTADPIGAVIETLVEPEMTTGSVADPDQAGANPQ